MQFWKRKNNEMKAEKGGINARPGMCVKAELSMLDPEVHDIKKRRRKKIHFKILPTMKYYRQKDLVIDVSTELKCQP